MPADTHFEPHRHAWAQLADCATGIVQVSAAAPDTATGEITYIVPPSRAVWIAPGARHSVHVLEDAEFRTLYIDASVTPPGWDGCRVLVVSPLLRELVHALDEPKIARPREALLTGLVLDELRSAATQALGVPLPPPQTGDKRLRALCEAVLAEPGRHATLEGWARDCGASPRTVARLFRSELGTSFVQWRQQVLLARAVALAARKMPMSAIAAELGYASPSAFSAMVRRSVGATPSRFLGS